MKYFVLIFISAFVLSSAPAPAQMMGSHAPPVPLTAAQFSAAHAGQSVQVEILVSARNRSSISGDLLEQQTQSQSKRTRKRVSLYFPDGTPIVMGTAADLNSGAVLFVNGVVTKPGHIDVKRLIVLTRFVEIR